MGMIASRACSLYAARLLVSQSIVQFEGVSILTGALKAF